MHSQCYQPLCYRKIWLSTLRVPGQPGMVVTARMAHAQAQLQVTE